MMVHRWVIAVAIALAATVGYGNNDTIVVVEAFSVSPPMPPTQPLLPNTISIASSLQQQSPPPPLHTGVQRYLLTQQQKQQLQQSQKSQDLSSSPRTTTATSTTIIAALQERKIPTPEEIAAKKRNFNIVFWGGGFVAPFLATVFYFGPKFWTK